MNVNIYIGKNALKKYINPNKEKMNLNIYMKKM